MAFTQLDPPIPLYVVDRGAGFAIAVIDYGQEFDLLWVVGMDDGVEIWIVPNPQVRLQANWSMGRQRKVSTLPKLAANKDWARFRRTGSKLSRSESVRRVIAVGEAAVHLADAARPLWTPVRLSMRVRFIHTPL